MSEFLIKYDIIYWGAGFLVLLLALKLDIKSQYDRSIDNVVAAIIFIGFILLFGLRSSEIGADTWNYLLIFDKLSNMNNLPGAIENIKGDLLFYFFTYGCTKFMNSQAYLTVIASLYMIPITLFVYKVTTSGRSFLLLAFISFFFFQSMGINVIRNGVSLGFMLFSLVLNSKEDRWKKVLCILVACFFHLSAVIILLCTFFIRFVKNSWIYYSVLLLSSAVAMAGYGLNNIPYVSEAVSFDRISVYVDSAANYKTGFRPEFWAFNIFFVIYAEFFCRRLHNPFYTKISRLFILLSAFFFLSFNLSYSDRFGILSWIFIPPIMYYPFARYRITYQLQHVLLLVILFGFRLFSVIYFSK